MEAGLGFKDFTTGEVLTAADVDGYLMQNIWVFATATARDAAVTSPQEGNFAFTKDNNSLWYYDGAAWVASGATGDIEGVTAGIGISGGGTSGTVTVTNSMATAIDAKGDLVVGTGADTFSKLTAGANGTILTADSAEATGLKWAAAAGGGGMTLLSTTTLSGSSTTVSVASNTYVYLVAIVNGVTTSQNCNVFIQINSITGASAYRPLQQGSDGNTLTACNGIYLTIPNVGPALGTGNSNNVWVNTFGNPNSTSMQTINTQGSWTYAGGSYDVAMTNQVTVNPGAVISSLVFKCDFTFGGGTVNLYGVK
jgi:hypothetical protein